MFRQAKGKISNSKIPGIKQWVLVPDGTQEILICHWDINQSMIVCNIQVITKYRFVWVGGGGSGTSGGGTGSGSGGSGGGTGGGSGDAPTPIIQNIFTNYGTLSNQHRYKLETLLYNMKDCLGQRLINSIVNGSDRLTIVVDPNLAAQATFRPTTNGNPVITIKDPNTLTRAGLEEELFHFYQHKTLRNGIGQYMPPNAGSANIEFEAKVLRDLNRNISYPYEPGEVAVTNPGYYYWLEGISSNFTRFPTSYDLSMSSYFSYMEQFLQDNPAYQHLQIDRQMPPFSMFNAVLGACPTRF